MRKRKMHESGSKTGGTLHCVQFVFKLLMASSAASIALYALLLHTNISVVIVPVTSYHTIIQQLFKEPITRETAISVANTSNPSPKPLILIDDIRILPKITGIKNENIHVSSLEILSSRGSDPLSPSEGPGVCIDSHTCAGPGRTPLSDHLQQSVCMTGCSTIWIYNNSLTIREKLQIYTQVISDQTQQALVQEQSRNPPTNRTLIKTFRDDTQQRGGLLRNAAVFKMVEENRFITTVHISPNAITAEDPRLGDGHTTVHSDDMLDAHFACTASGSVLEWTRSMGHNPPICLPDVHTLLTPSRDMDPRSYNYHGWEHQFRDRESGYGNQSSFSADWNINCDYCTQTPKAVTFIHIIRHAVMVEPAVAYQFDTKLRIVPLQCRKTGKKFPLLDKFTELLSPNAECAMQTTRDVIFSIANHFQGTDARFNFYHTFGESTMKLSLYADFLRTNPHISIYVRGKSAAEWVKNFAYRYLGLKNEVVSGTAFARVLLLPEGNPCFHPGYLYLQSSRELLTKYMQLDVVNSHNLPNSMLYIQRTKSRMLVPEKRITAYLSALAKRNNLEFNVFSDIREISTFVAANYFYNSFLTIGAHGAGLTNIVFARPRTAVFEIVCEVSPVTFMQMSHKLGLRHHAFYGDRVGKKRCDEGITLENTLFDFQIKVEQILKIVLDDFNNK